MSAIAVMETPAPFILRAIALLFLMKHRWSATGSSLPFRRFQASKCSLPQKISLKFGESSKNCEDQPAAGVGGVDFFGEGGKPDADSFEVGNRFQQVRKASAEPVQAPHGQRVVRSKVFDDCGQLRAVVFRAGCDVGPDLVVARGRQSVRLQSWVLICRRYPRAPQKCAHKGTVLQNSTTVSIERQCVFGRVLRVILEIIWHVFPRIIWHGEAPPGELAVDGLLAPTLRLS